MHTVQIKNLSIALEALTRVQGVEFLITRVRYLLEEEIIKMEKYHRQTNTPVQAPAQTDLGDDIPF